MLAITAQVVILYLIHQIPSVLLVDIVFKAQPPILPVLPVLSLTLQEMLRNRIAPTVQQVACVFITLMLHVYEKHCQMMLLHFMTLVVLIVCDI